MRLVLLDPVALHRASHDLSRPQSTNGNSTISQAATSPLGIQHSYILR